METPRYEQEQSTHTPLPHSLTKVNLLAVIVFQTPSAVPQMKINTNTTK